MGAFPLLTLNYFKCSGIIVADMNLGEWAGLLFLGLGLMDDWKPFLSIFLLPWTIGPDGLWAFSEFLDFRIWSAVD